MQALTIIAETPTAAYGRVVLLAGDERPTALGILIAFTATAIVKTIVEAEGRVDRSVAWSCYLQESLFDIPQEALDKVSGMM